MQNGLDAGDLRILGVLQAKGRLTNQELADKVGMSTSPCWRRVKRLEESGVIKGYQAVLDRRSVGLGVLAFIRVGIDSHSEAEARRFEKDVLKLDEVVACYSIAGDADFLLQVVARDLDAYAEFAMTVVRRLPASRKCRPPSCSRRSNLCKACRFRRGGSSASTRKFPIE
jgi:Lrp/AsnC family transcriptional regulator, leucine-responsive regulatory protein